ncbi:hypothetical protein V5P93_002294 [Actinokineospora auranticolor]|uniref:Uncharacterized protein n=1 Tax=Actinokineospora auranticolor TaxID=155976 RepID=A0A2S6GDL1_9PSEU|nr:hypothetical protein [Actinokineospora auranticolor]PPK63322.1 hypothetical protein CLV40_12935 [Actinokineospora auranticolor]
MRRPLAIRRDWAGDVRGCGIDSGYHLVEEALTERATALSAFLQAR